jgi:hypothetical protein
VVALDSDRTVGSQLGINGKSVLMFRSTNKRAIAAAWVAILATVGGAAALFGVPMTGGIGVLWFAACVVPPAVMLTVWRGAPPPTISEILYTVDRRD